MTFADLVRTAAIAAVLVSPRESLAAADIRLGDDVVPTFQAIELEIDADRPDYRGEVRIELEVRRATRHFLLHSEGLTIERLALRSVQGEVAVKHQPENAEVLRVTAEEPLAEGAYALEIAFTNPFDTTAVSLYRMEADGVGYVFSQFQADDAREAFPCWDEPRFKFPYQMTLKVPEAHLAITNTPALEERVEDGWRTTVFAKTPPMPSYLLAVATGPLEAVEMPGLGVPGRLITVQGQSHLTQLAKEMTPPILKALEDYFGRPYPYAKLDFLALPEFWPGAMENPGAVTYADRILLVDADSASVGQRRRMAGIIGHELAHMWFGDLVTMAWWDDLWLNEAFATWMGDKAAHRVFPQFGIDVTAVERAQGVLRQDARATTRAIRKPVDSVKNLLDGLGLTYQKGRAVLGMFEQWLGPDVFQRGVVSYIEEHAWGNAQAADLWRALDKASGKPVSQAMTTFFEQPGFPLIDLEILEDGRIQLTQERFRNYGSKSPAQAWQIPVTLKVSIEGDVREITVLLEASSQVVDLGGASPAWIYPNANSNGYYRWRLPAAQLEALAKNASSVLTPRERVGLIGNVSALLDAGSIRGDQYLGVLGELAHDPEPLVVTSMLGALQRVKTAFVPAELEDAFAGYVRRTLRPALVRFGMQQVAGEPEAVSLVRPTLYGWLGSEGQDPEVLAAARRMAAAYMKDPSKVDPALAGVALGLAAFEGDRKRFDEYTRRLESAESPVGRRLFLQALGAFRSTELRQAALDYSLTGKLRPNELVVPIQALAGTAAGRELAYRWMTQHFDALVSRLPPLFVGFMPRFAAGCSAERLEHARGFFAERGNPMVMSQLEKVSEEVNDCVSLREREGAAVARYLKRAGSGS
ncbi:MAG: M1 family aminopeptidase [Acidobacteriota bacterium]